VTTEDSRTLTPHITTTAVQAPSPAGDPTGPATGEAATPTATRGARALRTCPEDGHGLDVSHPTDPLQSLGSLSDAPMTQFPFLVIKYLIS
jgi:hypothetical protein